MTDRPTFPASRRFDVLAFGDPNIDLLFTVAHTPAADQKVLGLRLAPQAGGTVANVACAVSLLGRPTLAYGRIAGDADGEFLRREYARAGVVTDHMRVVPGAVSPTALILIEASGEKALVYAPMPGWTLHAASLAAALGESRLLYAMPYDLAEFEQVHRLARAAGVPLAIDIEAAMAPGRAHLERLLALADIVFMNDTTWRTVMASKVDESAMRALLQHGPQLLVVSCGARGAMLATRAGTWTQPAFPATVVDSTGAGDCFNGAFLAALLEGQAPDAALRFACAAGSIAVTAIGARAALPTRAQVDGVLAAPTGAPHAVR